MLHVAVGDEPPDISLISLTSSSSLASTPDANSYHYYSHQRSHSGSLAPSPTPYVPSSYFGLFRLNKTRWSIIGRRLIFRPLVWHQRMLTLDYKCSWKIDITFQRPRPSLSPPCIFSLQRSSPPSPPPSTSPIPWKSLAFPFSQPFA